MKRIKSKLIFNQAFRPTIIPKTKDVFRRLGFKMTSQSTGGEVADFSRSGLEAFSRTQHNFEQWQYEEYAKQKALEESRDDKPSDDVKPSDDDKPSDS